MAKDKIIKQTWIKKRSWKINPFILVALMVMFLMGFTIGMVWQQAHFIKGAVEIAEGLEGTTFNIEVDINETIMVDRFFKLFNDTLQSNLKEENIKERSLKNCTGINC